MRTFQLHGVTLASDFPFTYHLAPASAPAEMIVNVAGRPPVAGGLTSLAPLYTSPRRTPEGESLAHLYRLPSWEVLHFPGTADFYIGAEEIQAVLTVPDRQGLAEIHLLGPVFSYWLELRGLSALHGSAVAVDAGAVTFLSRSGGGKSGLAAAVMQAGGRLLTDDVLPVEETGGAFLGRPSYPQMRMWPDQAEHFLGSAENMPLVQAGTTKRRVLVGPEGFGSFQPTPLPLAGLFVARRRGPEEPGGVDIEALSSVEAVIELVRHSFSPHLVEAAGLQPARLDRFARLVRAVPVRRLTYPTGFERLPEVVAALLDGL